MGTNRFGTEEKDLIFSLDNFDQTYLHAEKFINAIRYIRKKAHLVAIDLDEFSPSDLFVMQLMRLHFAHDNGGTATTLPDDIIETLNEIRKPKNSR